MSVATGSLVVMNAPATLPRAGSEDSPILISFEEIRKEFQGGTVAVNDLTLDVRTGELLVLVGPSGCGKSTTLRMVNRLVEPTSGRVLLEGADVAHSDPVALRRRVGYVIQHVGLFPHRTVSQNVATVPQLLGWDKKRTRARVAELLTLVALDPDTYGKRYPHELSGGERQRVGVARALAVDPPVLLMDEPFGAVDPEGRRRLQTEFQRIHRELGTTVMLVTHDIDEAVLLGDRVAVFSKGGVIEQLDAPLQLLAHPANATVEQFIGSGRSVRMLTLGHITHDDLKQAAAWPNTNHAANPASAGGTAPSVPLGASLDEAFGALATSPTTHIMVTQDGQPVGTLSADGLLAALRRLAQQTPAEV
jgi:osmoprotectant transport system ATP-binding protein